MRPNFALRRGTLTNSPIWPSASVVWIVVLGSSLLSLLCYMQDPLLNNDGALYAVTAQEIVRGGANTNKIYDLTFYPSIIAAISKSLNTDVIQAGRILNIFLAGLLAHAFLRFYKLMFLESRWLWLAGLLLLCHDPLIDLRSNFLREFGMWPFCLYALAEIRIYQKRPNWKSAFLWPIYLCIAIAFRYEAATLLLLAGLPLTEPRIPWSERFRNLVRFNTLILSAIVPLLAWAVLSDNHFISSVLGRISRLLTQMQTNWGEGQGQMLEHVLTHPGNRDTIGMTLFIGLTALLPIHLFKAWSAYYWVVFFSAWRKIAWENSARNLFTLAFILILLNLTLYLHARWFMNSRYPMLAALLLLLPTAAVLGAWIERQRLACYVVAFMLFASLADGLISTSSSKGYMFDAIDWARDNLPSDSRLSGNSLPMIVQSSRNYDGRNHEVVFSKQYRDVERRLLRPEIMEFWKQVDYLIVRVKSEDREYAQLLMDTKRLEKIRDFSNEDGDTVYIYRVTKPQPLAEGEQLTVRAG